MMLMFALCFLVQAHAGNPPALPERVGRVSLPQGAVNDHDRLDDISRLVFGGTIGELQSYGASDRVFTDYNLMQEQFMRTVDWMKIEINNLRTYSSDDDRYYRGYHLPHVKAYYEMVLEWLEDTIHRGKSRVNVIKDMTRQWKMLDDKAQAVLTSRFIGFQLINDMANNKWQ